MVRTMVYSSVFVVLLVVVVLLTAPRRIDSSAEELNNRKSGLENAPKASSSNSNAKVDVRSKNKNHKFQNSPKYSGTVTVDFTLRRVGYDALDYFDPNYDSQLTYVFLTDYKAVIEPSVEMEFFLYDSSSLYEGIVYEFFVCPDSGSSCQSGEYYYDNSTQSIVSDSVIFNECTPQSDTYTITVFTVTSDGEVINQYSATAICMYVRREIRSLSTSDLNTFLNASYQLYNLTSEEGIALYGDSFMTNHQFVKLHYFNAGQRDADHMHEGNGFYAQHLKITNMFEASVQLVEPSVALPYWDFTIDAAGGSKVFDSFIASADVYGSVTYPSGDDKAFTNADDSVVDAKIPDGRWANLLTETEYNANMSSAYGYLRAPWCLNPSPYVSRFAFDWDVAIGYLPSCKSHYEILEYTDMMDYFYEISLTPHGSAHTTIGGLYGCDAMNYLTDMGVFSSSNSQHSACADMANVIKEIYRYGYVDVPTGCELNSTDPSTTNCSYSCVGDEGGFKAAVFMYGLVHSHANTTAYSKTELISLFKTFICDGAISKMYAGDHYESSAVSDPSFWVIHPTIERLTHAKFMSGGFDDETWATSTEDDFICTKQICYDEDLDQTSNFTSCCYGHYEYDRMYNGIISSRDDYIGSTNHHIIAATDPRSSNYSVNYIYDKFSWNHCGDDYPIITLLNELYSDYDMVKQGKKAAPARLPNANQLETRAKLKKYVDGVKDWLATAGKRQLHTDFEEESDVLYLT